MTFRLRGNTLAKALELMLSPFNATYMIDEGVVVIISKDNAHEPEFLRVKMFDCKKLIEATGAKKLRELALSMCNPGSWLTNDGGGEGVISEVSGILVVKQDEKTLREIGEILTDLKGKVLGETKEVALKPQPKKQVKAPAKPKQNAPIDDGNPFQRKPVKQAEASSP